MAANLKLPAAKANALPTKCGLNVCVFNVELDAVQKH